MIFYDLQDIDPGSPNLHAIEIFSHTISHKNLVLLAFIGAELAGRADSAPPLPGRVILNPITGRGLIEPRDGTVAGTELELRR